MLTFINHINTKFTNQRVINYGLTHLGWCVFGKYLKRLFINFRLVVGYNLLTDCNNKRNYETKTPQNTGIPMFKNTKFVIIDLTVYSVIMKYRHGKVNKFI